MSMIVSRPLSTCSSPGVSLTRSMSYQTLWKKTARDAHRKNRVSKLLQEWKLGQTEVEYFNKIMATLAAKEKAKEDEKFYNLLEFAKENFNEHPVTVARSGRLSLRKGSSNVAPMSKSDMIMYLDQPHIMTSHINLYDPAVVIMAITTFKEIWKYMHGEVKQDDNAVVRHIVARCIENEALRDEVYCQLMRQTNGCPSQDALLRGWEMMTFCASCFSPSKSLSKYLISYLKKHCNVEALSKYAKTSLRHLRVARITPRKMPPSDTEIKALRGFGLIVCRLRFLDGMSKAVDIQSYDCAETVVKSVSERIGLKSTDGWALYECVGHQERFMRSREYISDIIAKWESGPKKDHGDFLVKKRLFKLPKEMPQDPIEYSLLYAQAVHSVVKLDEFGVSEVTAVQLAGLHCQILLGEPYDNKLDRYDEIGQFLPERITAGKPKQDWRSVLAEAHKEYGSGKPTLVAKVWYLTCVKQFPLYGSTLFPVTYKGMWSHNSDLCLAVHADGVMFVDQRSKDIWYQYRYEEFESISLVPSEDCINFELNAEVADVQKSFTFQTPDKEDVSALIASYSPAHASWLKTGRHVSRKLVRGKERERLQEELIKCRQALVEKGLLRKPNYDSGSTFMSTLRKFRKGGAKLKDEDEAKIFKAYNKEYWSFSKAPITHSLSVMNEEAVASKLFSSILMFSGLQKSGGLGSVSDTFDLIQNVMRECLASVDLRNELFMQLIKQTTDHPEPNSKVNVTHWQLLAVACSVMAPPDKLILSYLQSHLKKCAADHASEEGQHAYFCQKCLAKSIDLKRKWPPSTREIAALLGKSKMTAVVHFSNGLSRTIELDSAIDFGEVTESVKSKIGMDAKTKGYCMYGYLGTQEHSLPSNENAGDNLYRCEKLSKANKLPFEAKYNFKKHLFLQPYVNQDDPLDEDFIDQQLMKKLKEGYLLLNYHEAVQVCARVAHAEIGDGFHDAKTFAPFVEKYMPSSLRSKIKIDDIVVEHKTLFKMETAEAKSQIREILQRWPLWASTIFEVKQTYTSNLPKTLWLAVSEAGVHLLKPHHRDVLNTHIYDQIVNYSPGNKQLLIVVGDVARGEKFIFNTTEASQIAHLIKDYCAAIRASRKREKASRGKSFNVRAAKAKSILFKQPPVLDT